MKITMKRALALLRKAVKAKGENHAVDECVYTDENGDHCIAGWVLAELGFEYDVDDGENGETFGVIQESLAENNLNFTESAVKVMTMAQAVQDGRWGSVDGLLPGLTLEELGTQDHSSMSWGAALDAACRVAALEKQS